MPEQATVVIIDDELQIREVVCDILEEEDIRVVPCDHGNKALGCIYEEQPSLVVLDVQMPGMDGIQIFQHMRARPQTTATPVIFLTANSHIVRERLPNYREQNAMLLPKPFEIVTLLDLVQSFLG